MVQYTYKITSWIIQESRLEAERADDAGPSQKPLQELADNKKGGTMIRYFEVMLDDGYSICIKGLRKPSKEEAADFLTERDLKGRKVVDAEEWDRLDAETAFDFEREAEWPIYS